MSIDKQALGILVIVYILIIPGFLGLIIPDRLDHIQKIILCKLNIISAERAGKPMTAFDRTRQRLISVLYVAGCIALLCNCHFQAGKVPRNENPAWQLYGEGDRLHSNSLDSLIRRIVEPAARGRGHSCIVVAVIADDLSNIYGFGRTDLRTGRPPDADTLFELGSVTKVFTGILLADYLRESKSSIDTPIVSLLPCSTYRFDDSVRIISLKHLVTHTSGLPGMPDCMFSPVAMYRSITAKNAYSKYTDAMMLETLSGGIGDRRPGAAFSYSNYGFGLLGLILRNAKNKSYQEMIEGTVARPLGMKDTTIVLDDDRKQRMATGYRCAVRIGPFHAAQVADYWDMPDSMAGCGAIRSTGRDMLAFLDAGMGRTRTPLSSALEMTHRVVAEKKSRTLFFFRRTHKVGMGWMHDNLPETGHAILWHNGGTGGFTSFIGFTKDRRFGVVVLNNTTNSVDELGLGILDSLYER